MNKIFWLIEVLPVSIFIVSILLAIFHNPLDIILTITCIIPILIYDAVVSGDEQ